MLLPIDNLLDSVRDWDGFIRSEIGEDAPWYPVLNRDGTQWGNLSNPGSVDSRRLSCSRSLKRFCKLVGIPYRSPHKLRNGHGVFGVKIAENLERYKAFSQNMMHGSMGVTDRLYGNLAREDVKKAVSSFGDNDLIDVDDEETLKEFREFQAFKRWQKNNLG